MEWKTYFKKVRYLNQLLHTVHSADEGREEDEKDAMKLQYEEEFLTNSGFCRDRTGQDGNPVKKHGICNMSKPLHSMR